MELKLVHPLDLEFACHTMVTEQSNFKQWQQRQWKCLARHIKKLRSFSQYYRPLRTATAVKVATDVDPGVLDVINRSMAWSDCELQWLPTIGVDIVGTLPVTGVFREASIAPE